MRSSHPSGQSWPVIFFLMGRAQSRRPLIRLCRSIDVWIVWSVCVEGVRLPPPRELIDPVQLSSIAADGLWKRSCDTFYCRWLGLGRMSVIFLAKRAAKDFISASLLQQSHSFSLTCALLKCRGVGSHCVSITSSSLLKGRSTLGLQAIVWHVFRLSMLFFALR
jgi:hypothetical protein